MKNIEQLLNKENWIKYLELADEGGITNHGIAQDIVSKIEQAINYSRCCTELNPEFKIGDKVVVTNRYVATISAFCADNNLIEIEDGCDYKQVDKEDVTKVV